MKVWITKYALTQGILDKELDVNGDRAYNPNNFYESYYKPDWWENREEAIADAEKRKQKKIASLKKQRARLENLKFE